MANADDPTVEDARAALVRANNSGRRFDFVVIEDRRQRWLWAAAEIGVEQGWLKPGKLVQLDEQSSELRYYLTDAGRALK